MTEAAMIVGVIAALVLLSGCGEGGPTREDMAGCVHGRTISHRDVADCAANRAARHEGEVK